MKLIWTFGLPVVGLFPLPSSLECKPLSGEAQDLEAVAHSFQVQENPLHILALKAVVPLNSIIENALHHRYQCSEVTRYPSGRYLFRSSTRRS